MSILRNPKLFITYFAIAISIICAVQLVRHYTGMIKNELSQKMEKLALVKQGGQKVMVNYDSTYTKSNNQNIYHISYKYTVNGKDYTGMEESRSEPTGDSKPIYYLSSDPSFASFDPEGEYNTCKKNLGDEGNAPVELWVGLLLAVPTAVLLLLSYKKAHREQKEMAEYRRQALSR